MDFHLQSPGHERRSLLQTLTDLAAESTMGGGIFAWATAPGLSILFGSPDFEGILKNGSFKVYIGTDSITDQLALDRARDLCMANRGLEARAVVNDSRSLFHPKFAWFANGASLYTVVGSGNLTKGGLLGSWEAFVVNEHPIGSLDDLLVIITEWLEDIEPGVVEIDDPRATEAVAGNKGYEKSVPKRRTPSQEDVAPDQSDLWLVAELNKSRKNSVGQSMFSQASFDKATFEKFFDFTGAEIDIVLYPVSAVGKTASVESTKGRYKSVSRNYYFELRAAQGIAYPETGRPIGVFAKLPHGGYLYRVLLPGEDGHANLSDWLKTHVSVTNATQMRRAVANRAVVMGAWPTNPMFATEPPAD